MLQYYTKYCFCVAHTNILISRKSLISQLTNLIIELECQTYISPDANSLTFMFDSSVYNATEELMKSNTSIYIARVNVTVAELGISKDVSCNWKAIGRKFNNTSVVEGMVLYVTK